MFSANCKFHKNHFFTGRFFTSLIVLTAAFCLTSSQLFAQSEKRVPVVVELFTSEGCSTCPPADKYLKKLIEDQPIKGVEIIALSEHVDYWNQQGWTDKFSSVQFSNRQKYYAVFFKRTEIFTPQFVVDGTFETVVKDGNKMFIEAAKKSKGDVSLEIKTSQENEISVNIKAVNLPEIAIGNKAVVVIAVTENNLSTNISGGENKGRKLEHAAVTRSMKVIGNVQGAETNLAAQIIPAKDWKRENLSVIVFVQEADSRRILGAAKIDLKN